MIWYICFILSIVVGAVLVKLALDKNFGKIRIVYIMLGCLAIAYILYIPPFFRQYNPTAAIFAGFINVLQVISLDADYLMFYDLIKSEISLNLFADLYYTLLAFIHVLLPAVSAMTAVTVVIQCLTELRIQMLKNRKVAIHVFSQMNNNAIDLARDIRKNDSKCDIVFLDDQDSSDFSELKQELECSILNEKIENIKVRANKRHVHYYCISDDQEGNLNSTLAIMSFLETENRAVQENHHVFLFSTDSSVETIIDSISKGAVNLIIIDEMKTAAYSLLQNHPLPYHAKNKEINVLVSGFTDMGKAFLKAAVWCGQLSTFNLKFTVIGKNIEEASRNFMAEYPGLFTDNYNLRFFSYQDNLEYMDLLKKEAADSNYIVVAEEQTDITIDKAIKLRTFFYMNDEKFENEPAIFAHISNAHQARAIASLKTAEARLDRQQAYNIVPFGETAEIYSYKNITDSNLENLSKNIHLVYEDIFSDGPIDVEGALDRYNLFEVNKNSNRANALHIKYKLLMLGLDYTDDPYVQEVDFEPYLTKANIDELTIAEHDRWMAFLESEGWVESTVEQSKAYQKSGISKGRHNCPLLRMHPYICAFEDLPARSEGLGLPDSTVYDRELIVRIPDILHDKWNVSGKKYKIIKSKLGGIDNGTN